MFFVLLHCIKYFYALSLCILTGVKRSKKVKVTTSESVFRQRNIATTAYSCYAGFFSCNAPPHSNANNTRWPGYPCVTFLRPLAAGFSLVWVLPASSSLHTDYFRESVGCAAATGVWSTWRLRSRPAWSTSRSWTSSIVISPLATASLVRTTRSRFPTSASVRTCIHPTTTWRQARFYCQSDGCPGSRCYL